MRAAPYGPGSRFEYATTVPAVERRGRKRLRDSFGRFLPSSTPRHRADVVAVTVPSEYVGRRRAEGEAR